MAANTIFVCAFIFFLSFSEAASTTVARAQNATAVVVEILAACKVKYPNTPDAAEAWIREYEIGLIIGKTFKGTYKTKGLYAYNSGYHKGHAYFGTGGTEEQMTAEVSRSVRVQHPGQYRPYQCMCDHVWNEVHDCPSGGQRTSGSGLGIIGIVLPVMLGNWIFTY